MNSYEREGYVEAELREAEAKAMSRHDSRDAASAVKIEYGDGYECPVIPEDNDRWVLDAKLGIEARIHVKSRRAKFEPSSVKDCPVSIDQILDARVTLVETEGAEFVVHDSWRKPTHSAMPFRWSGKTVFVLRQSMSVEVKLVLCLRQRFRIRHTAMGLKPSLHYQLLLDVLRLLTLACHLRSRRAFGLALGKLRREPGASIVWMYVQDQLKMMIRVAHSKCVSPILQTPTVLLMKDVLLRLLHFTLPLYVRLHSPLKKMKRVMKVTPLTCLLLRLRVLCIPISLKSLFAVPPTFTVVMTRLWFATVHAWHAQLIAKSGWPIPRLRPPSIKSGISSSLKGAGTTPQFGNGQMFRPKTGAVRHVGRIFDICVEKKSELPESDPNRKFKGRFVFEGCHVKDEDNNWAKLSEITSCPAPPRWRPVKPVMLLVSCPAMILSAPMVNRLTLRPSLAVRPRLAP